MVVESQERDGSYRFWSTPMPESEVGEYIAREEPRGWELSDVDHAAQCWCHTSSEG